MSNTSSIEPFVQRKASLLNDQLPDTTVRTPSQPGFFGRWIRRLLYALFFIGAGAGVWWFVSHRGAKAVASATAPTTPVAPVMVTVAPVTARPMVRSVSVVGSLWGQEEITVAPKVEGRVKRILHDMGDVVHPGDLLLEIEETEFQLAVDEAQRALDLELSKLGLRVPPTDNFDVKELPSIKRTEALMKNAASVRERYRRLSEGARTEEERERIETEYSVAQANHQQMILEANATLASVRYRLALLASAQQKLKETKVYVPEPQQVYPNARLKIDFVIAQRSISIGEMVRMQGNNGTSLFRLVIADQLKLQAAIPERYLGEVKTGQLVKLYIEAYPKQVFQGSVSRVNTTVDRASRTFTVEIAIPNSDRKLSAGSFAKANIITQENAQALTVPEEAVSNFAGVTKVFTYVDGKARSVPVTLGDKLLIDATPHARTWVEVTNSSLTAGTNIITSGFNQLSDGSAVKVRSSSSAAQ